MDIDKFVQGYLECALWSSTDNSDDSGGSPLDDNYSIDDIPEAEIAKAIAECADFRQFAEKELASYPNGDELAGHDFWLTRNGHGAGFWDRGLGKLGQVLTDKAHSFGESYLYIGDDGKLYFA